MNIRPLLVMTCVGIIIFLGIVLTEPFFFGETQNFKYKNVSPVEDGIEIEGTDGHIYLVCNASYLDALASQNITVYYRIKDGKRVIEEYIFPDVTFLKRVICEVKS